MRTWTLPLGASLYGRTANQVQHRPATRLTVESHLRTHLYPALGDQPLNSIARSDVQAWVTGLSSTLAPATVNVVYSYLASIFKSATADGIIAVTPCRDIALPKVTARRVIPLTIEQIEAIASATQHATGHGCWSML